MNSFAQDSRLFENIWYLHDLVIDGIHNIPPVNNEIPFVPAEFIETGEFYTGMCESGCSGQIIYNGSTEFTFQDFACLLGGCYQNEPFNEDFNNLYVNIYWLPTTQNIYTYTITENGSNRILIIVNSNGDEAIFGDELLSTDDFDELSITTFPNPIQDVLRINNTSNLKITSIKIYDLSGRLVLNKKSNINQVEVSHLNSGSLFLEIETEHRVVFKKMIKE